VISKIIRFKSAGFFLLGLFEKYCLQECTAIRLDTINRIKRVCEGITPEILRLVLENFERDFDYVYGIIVDILNI